MRVQIFLVIFMCSMFVGPVHSQRAETFDRFFTSRGIRKQLDQARDQYTVIGINRDFENETSQELMFPELQVKGLIVHSDGSSDFWLNNTSSIGEDSQSRDIRTNTRRVGAQQIQITLPDGEEVTLKPGQIYLPQSQRVLEKYQANMPSKSVDLEQISEKDTQKLGEQTDEPAEFDESILAETDNRIKLLEERLQELENRTGSQ